MARPRGRSTFPQNRYKPRGWISSTPATGVTALAGSTNALVEVVTPLVADLTVLRIRGMFSWQNDQASASEVNVGAIGIIRVEEPAATVGISAIPVPGTDADSDWIWHSYFADKYEFQTAAGFDPRKMNQIVVDSKAMRRINGEQRFVIVIENQAAQGIQFVWHMRMLVQEPTG